MTVFRDIFTLLARLLLGTVLIAHGWQKYDEWTINGVQQNFEQMGTPAPEISAQLATYFELAGGALLILGLLVRLVGPILFVQMVGAFWFAHRDSGIFVSDGGWELVGVIGAAGLALAASGAGRISLDHLLSAPMRRRKEKKELEKDQARQEQLANAYATVPAGAGTAGAGTAGATYSAPQATPGANTQSTSAPVTSTNAGGASEDAATTQFNAPQTGDAGTTNNVDPNAPTTQWPGNPNKK
ncbi:MAG TPA: DoxX family protein [Candidatus Corynebacterium gallistercoris]|uniref:DoxX family protein n=1 Tax=Candidatus Corynebacterium gallistercoris TaxID=2838530 RepID=A0A9D1UQA4_9CORY|nr:DoxX family protein [Candidatus Corynebacterium gallistercoris]